SGGRPTPVSPAGRAITWDHWSYVSKEVAPMPLRHPRHAMRDLLYLSESKMAVLVPQLPGRVRERLGMEAGLNAGVLSLRASLSSDSRTSPVGALNAVVKMIERKHGHRQRTDRGLAVGSWIKFEEEFRFGSAWPGS